MVLLHEDLLFHFSHDDGFTERLLSIDIVVYKDFSFELFTSAFQEENDFLEGELPSKIQVLFSNLIAIQSIPNINQYSFPEGMDITDCPSQQYYLNQGSKTKFFFVEEVAGHHSKDYEEGSDKRFLLFHEAVVAWYKQLL